MTAPSETKRKRGRPRKVRPTSLEELRALAEKQGHVSLRDMAAAIGKTKREVEQCLAFAAIPDKIFDALLEGDRPVSQSELEFLGRRLAGKSLPPRIHSCPRCGHVLRIEDRSGFLPDDVIDALDDGDDEDAEPDRGEVAS